MSSFVSYVEATSTGKKHESFNAVEALEETWNIFLVGNSFTHVEIFPFYDWIFFSMLTSNHLDFEVASLVLDDAISVEWRLCHENVRALLPN